MTCSVSEALVTTRELSLLFHLMRAIHSQAVLGRRCHPPLGFCHPPHGRPGGTQPCVASLLCAWLNPPTGRSVFGAGLCVPSVQLVHSSKGQAQRTQPINTYRKGDIYNNSNGYGMGFYSCYVGKAGALFFLLFNYDVEQRTGELHVTLEVH